VTDYWAFAYHLFILADTDDEHFSTKLHCLGHSISETVDRNDLEVAPYIDGSVYAALHARALDCKLHSTVSGGFDFFSGVLWSRLGFDKYRAHTRYELLGDIEAALEEIGDNNWLSTCSTCRKERNKTNRSSTAVDRSTDHSIEPSTAHAPDKGGVPEAQASTFDASESYGQGLAKRTLFKGEGIRQTVQPLGRVQVPTSEGS